jgi:hypothetical protein
MESIAVSESPEALDVPSLLAYVVAHIVIGVLVAIVTKVVFRQKVAVALAAGGIAVTVHSNIDAPLARRLTDFGI